MSVKAIHLSRLVLSNSKECQYILKASRFVRHWQSCFEAKWSALCIHLSSKIYSPTYVNLALASSDAAFSKKTEFLWLQWHRGLGGRRGGGDGGHAISRLGKWVTQLTKWHDLPHRHARLPLHLLMAGNGRAPLNQLKQQVRLTQILSGNAKACWLLGLAGVSQLLPICTSPLGPLQLRIATSAHLSGLFSKPR